MKRTERAMQIWQILLGAAHNRQTVTYGQIADHLGLGGAGVLSQTLDLIHHYCVAKELPSITCLVVNQESGIPGSGYDPAVGEGSLHAIREEVYRKNWYALFPAQIADFEAIAVAN